jgi:hypothetical protein
VARLFVNSASSRRTVREPEEASDPALCPNAGADVAFALPGSVLVQLDISAPGVRSKPNIVNPGPGKVEKGEGALRRGGEEEVGPDGHGPARPARFHRQRHANDGRNTAAPRGVDLENTGGASGERDDRKGPAVADSAIGYEDIDVF